MRYLLLILGLILAIVLLRGSVFTVNPTEFVYVTQFGRHVATYDGASDGDAGLHFRWPWPVQSVQRLDRRLQYFDLPGIEVLTHDEAGKAVDKTLTVEAYVCWRILPQDAAAAGKDAKDTDPVDRFVRAMGTPDRVKVILGQHLNGRLGALVGKRNMDDLISTAAMPDGKKKVDVKMDELRQQLLAELRPQARQEYGIDVVDVRLRRFNHPVQVREAIFERIRSERNRKAEFYRSEGTKEAANIASAAEEKRRTLLAQARATEKILKGEADTDADRIRNQAHSKDPEFYAFLKKLEKMQSILSGNKTVLLLSTHRPFFDMMFQPTQPNGARGVPPVIGASPAGNGATVPAPKTGSDSPKGPTGATGGP
jgi:membrane protease subunit HflC